MDSNSSYVVIIPYEKCWECEQELQLQLQKAPSRPVQQQPQTQTQTQTQTSHKWYNCICNCNSFECYNTDTSKDMRCCGWCYYRCYQQNTPEEDKSVYCCCPETFKVYLKSDMLLTTHGKKIYIDVNGDKCDEACCCTIMCMPIKIPLFIPCCIGSICNNIINLLRNTHMNYLC